MTCFLRCRLITMFANKMKKVLITLICLFSSFLIRAQQKNKVNYDESKVPPYTLEDPLLFANGKKVRKAQWPKRREEILQIFQREMYGQLPPVPDTVVVETIEEGTTMADHALRRQVRMWFRTDKKGPSINWLILSPSFAKSSAIR